MTDNQQRAAEVYELITYDHDPEATIARALDAAEARGRAELAALIEELHSSIDHGTGPQCQGCATSVTFTPWPCKTIAALRGEQ